MHRSLYLISLLGVLLLICPPVIADEALGHADSTLFPRPPGLEPDIRFWVRVYTEINSNEGFIHDNRYLNIVYGKIKFEPGISRKQRNKIVKKVKNRYKEALLKIARSSRKNLNDKEQKILALWPDDVSDKDLRQAAKYLRFQLGQSDKFTEGLVRSGRWMPYIEKTLKEMDLPLELSVLPHVESSFNPKAYSFVGAAGMWQFTRSTGRRFMRIDHIIDERLDPFISTVAAARLLKHNYATTGAWPLAVTAYNHGASGMRRAIAQTGGTEVEKILREYKGRTFKFASRNFYVAFLAAYQVNRRSSYYFGTVVKEPLDDSVLIEMPDYIQADTLAQALDIDFKVLSEMNPALRPPVWGLKKYVPRGYKLRVPKNINNGTSLVASISDVSRFNMQLPDLTYKVRRGDSLSLIAGRHKLRVKDLMAMNNLSNRHFIRVGQVLKLPQKPGRVQQRRIVDGKYTVQRGDTLSLIAKSFAVNEQALMSANNISQRHKIIAGQQLNIAAARPQASQKPIAVAALEQVPKAVKPSQNNESQAVEIKQKDLSASEVGETAVLSEQAQPISLPAPSDASEDLLTVTDQPETDQLATEFATDEQPQETVAISTATAIAADESEAPVVAAELRAVAVDKIEEAEPASEEEAIAIAPVQPAGLHPALSADPSDYSVTESNTIVVYAVETLGHYAEWLELRANDLRKINRMRFGKPVIIGQRLKLDFSKVDPKTFEQRRVAFHRGVQELYFSEYQIVGTNEYTVKNGDSIWELTHVKYAVPLWLFLQYNPDVNLDKIRPGVKVVFPDTQRRSEAS